MRVVSPGLLWENTHAWSGLSQETDPFVAIMNASSANNAAPRMMAAYSAAFEFLKLLSSVLFVFMCIIIP